MSYWCQICFKQVDGCDVYSFLQQFKSETMLHLAEIANANAIFSPLYKAHTWEKDFEASREVREATMDWARAKLFRYRFFYDKKHRLLGVYSVDKSMHGLFDLVHEFQNSCDQNYDFDSWNGIEHFESIATKWKNAPADNLKKFFEGIYQDDWDSLDDENLDYWRQSAAYQEIWEHLEWSLEDDDSVLYFSLFGFYDGMALMEFYACLLDAVEQRIANLSEGLNMRM